jgi:hypothetical protein
LPNPVILPNPRLPNLPPNLRAPNLFQKPLLFFRYGFFMALYIAVNRGDRKDCRQNA